MASFFWNRYGDESLSLTILFLLLLQFSLGTSWASWTTRNWCEYIKRIESIHLVRALLCFFCHKTEELCTTDLIPSWGRTSFDSETDTVTSVWSHTSWPISWPQNLAAIHGPVLFLSFSPPVTWLCALCQSYVMWFNITLPYYNMNFNMLSLGMWNPGYHHEALL